MYLAMDVGISVDAFWDMSAHAVYLLHLEMRKSYSAAQRGKGAAKAGSSARAPAPKVMPMSMLPRP